MSRLSTKKERSLLKPWGRKRETKGKTGGYRNRSVTRKWSKAFRGVPERKDREGEKRGGELLNITSRGNGSSAESPGGLQLPSGVRGGKRGGTLWGKVQERKKKGQLDHL